MTSRVVIVTGSSSGIGEAIAKLFAKNGYKVVVHGSSSQEKVDKVVAECDKLSPNNNKALGLVVDFSEPDKADILVTKTIEHFGQLDVLVNNAGILARAESQFSEALYSCYKKTKAVNLDSTVRVTYKALEFLRNSKNNPNIVFVSSVGSEKPARGGTAYCVTKAAMTMFAKCLALELAPTIRSNIVSPGPVYTPIFKSVGLHNEVAKAAMGKLTLLQRMGEPQEVAEAVMYLAEDKASWITGTDLVLDGGYRFSDTGNVSSVAKEQVEGQKE